MSRSIWDDVKRGGVGRSTHSRKVSAERKSSIRRIVDNTAEVYFEVKRSTPKNGGSKDYPCPRSAGALKGLIEYLSREETETLKDEQGFSYTGPGAVSEAIDGWYLPDEDSHQREAIHCVLSMNKQMPDGSTTDVAGVHRAAEQTAAWLFRNHKYVLAHHIDSESGHPHTHVVVKCEPKNLTDGTKRLNPKRQQLRRYRNEFAKKLNENGITCSATSRKARLSTREYVDHKNYEKLKRKDKSNGTNELEKAKSGEAWYGIDHQVEQYKQDAIDLVATGDAKDYQLAVDLNSWMKQKLGMADTATEKQSERASTSHKMKQ